MRDITPEMVQQIHRRISKSAGNGTANVALKVFRTVYAEQYHLLKVNGRSTLPENPVSAAMKPRRKGQKSRWNPATPQAGHIAASELPGWWAATEQIAGTRVNARGKTFPFYRTGNGAIARDYLQFVITTGLRREEAFRLMLLRIVLVP